MNRKQLVRAAALVGATGMLSVGALATSASADVSALQRVNAKATQAGNFTVTVCINDNTTGACATLRRGQSFDRFPTYNGNEPISIAANARGSDFETVRVRGNRLNVVVRGSAQRPVIQVR
jgi:hypothetical protein